MNSFAEGPTSARTVVVEHSGRLYRPVSDALQALARWIYLTAAPRWLRTGGKWGLFS